MQRIGIAGLRADIADPLQLALYRLAWAELQGVDVDCVDAVFCDVPTGRIVRPARLVGRVELDAMVRRAVGAR